MQFFIKQLRSIVLVTGSILLLIACGEKNQTPLAAMIEECSMVYKLSDVKEVASHYSQQATSKSDYIAFKHYLRNGGYQLVSLIKKNENYELSVSIIPVSGSLLTATVDSKTALSLFSRLDEINTFSAPESPGTITHPECVLTAVKRQSTQKVGYFYNPNENEENSENKDHRLYALLSALTNKHFPDYKVNAAKKNIGQLKPVMINEQLLYEDDYIPPTEKEAEQFLDLLKADPFFELNIR